MSDEIELYAGVGLCHTSICCPKNMPIDDLITAVNRKAGPTGLDHGWLPSTAERFASGEPNPAPCECDPSRVHRLFEC